MRTTKTTSAAIRIAKWDFARSLLVFRCELFEKTTYNGFAMPLKYFFFCISTHISIRFAYAYNASDNANTQTGRRTTATNTNTTKIDTVCFSRLLLLLFFLLLIIQCVLIRCVSVRRHDLTLKIVKTPFDSLESMWLFFESVGNFCVVKPLGLCWLCHFPSQLNEWNFSAKSSSATQFQFKHIVTIQNEIKKHDR